MNKCNDFGVNLRKIKTIFILFLGIGILGFSWGDNIEELESEKILFNPPESPIVIAIDVSMEPFSMIDEEGKPTGFTVDLWKLWGEKSGYSVEFYMTNWSGAMRALEEGSVAFHSGLAKTEEREAWIDYSEELFFDHGKLFYKPSHISLNIVEDLKGRKIGVIKGTSEEDYLNRNYPFIQTVPFLGYKSMLEAVDYGFIDGLFGSETVVKYQILEMARYGAYATFGEPQLSDSFYAGVLKGNSEMLNLINDGLNQISEEEWSGLLNKWIKPLEESIAMEEGTFELTAEEKEWIEKHPEIRLGIVLDMEPFIFVDT